MNEIEIIIVIFTCGVFFGIIIGNIITSSLIHNLRELNCKRNIKGRSELTMKINIKDMKEEELVNLKNEIIQELYERKMKLKREKKIIWK